MILRSRLIITAFLACHAFIIPQLLTSQLRTPDSAQVSSQPTAESPAATPSEQQPQSGASSQPAIEIVPQSEEGGSSPATDHDLQEMEKALTEQVQESDAQESQPEGSAAPSLTVPLGRDEVLIFADHQDKMQDIYHLRGHVVVRFRDYILHCDEADYDSTTGVVTAKGHVVFDGGKHNEHLTATHGTYDVSRDTGTFYDVNGSTGMRVKNKQMFLTSSTPFFFQGKVVDKLGPDTYRVHHGFITSCRLPKPKWRFVAETATIEVGDDARMHHATLRMGRIPVFYFPYAQYPIDNLGRKSGFLIPVTGISTTRGTIIGDGFYWAINRSSDATIGAELYIQSGWAQHGVYRALGYKYFFQRLLLRSCRLQRAAEDGTKSGRRRSQIQWRVLLPHDFRGVVSVDYLSSYPVSPGLWTGLHPRPSTPKSIPSGSSAAAATATSERSSWRRYQNYQSSTQEDVIDIAHLPSFQFAGVESPLVRFKVYVRL